MKEWTRKEKYMHNHLDSSRWNHIKLQSGDIIISTYPKSGTTRETMTWAQLLHGGVEGLDTTKIAQYIEVPLVPIDDVVAILELQRHKRIMRSHLPLEYLPYKKDVIYVDVWRHPIDLAISFYHHHNNGNQKMFDGINANRPEGTEEFLPNTLSLREWVVRWFETDGKPYFSYSKHINSWWIYKNLKNVYIFHYGDLKKNGLVAEVNKRAEILGLNFNPKELERIANLCSFEKMKKNASTSAPFGGVVFGKGTGEEFFRKGKSGEWKQYFNEDEAQNLLDSLRRRISEDAAEYLIQ